MSGILCAHINNALHTTTNLFDEGDISLQQDDNGMTGEPE